jgi:hypothetical protein
MLSFGQVRLMVEDRLGDFDPFTLDAIIQAEIEAVERAAGADDEASEVFVHDNGQRPKIISTTRALLAPTLDSPESQPLTIEERWSLTDAALTLVHNADYRILDTHRILRLPGGPHGAYCWGAEVVVYFTPVCDQALRLRICADLVVLSAQFTSYRSEAIGDYSVSSGPYGERRRELLGQLTEGRLAAQLL